MVGLNILKELDALFLLKTSAYNGVEENDVLWLNDVFANVSMDDITCADANITYYVSGYVGRSISFHHKCSSCKELLIAGDDSFSIHHYLPDEYKQMFENVNCGACRNHPNLFTLGQRLLRFKLNPYQHFC